MRRSKSASTVLRALDNPLWKDIARWGDVDWLLDEMGCIWKSESLALLERVVCVSRDFVPNAIDVTDAGIFLAGSQGEDTALFRVDGDLLSPLALIPHTSPLQLRVNLAQSAVISTTTGVYRFHAGKTEMIAPVAFELANVPTLGLAARTSDGLWYLPPAEGQARKIVELHDEDPPLARALTEFGLLEVQADVRLAITPNIRG